MLVAGLSSIMPAMPSTAAAPYHSVYRFKWFARALALVFVVLGASFSWDIWRVVFAGLRQPKIINVTIASILLIAGLVMTIHSFVAKVTFTLETIEHRTIFGTKCLPLNGVLGRRVQVVRSGGPEEGGNTRYLKVESNDDRTPGLSFSTSYTFDEAFYSWFFSLPDLDMRNKEGGNGSSPHLA
jgi:hypothetical protein